MKTIKNILIAVALILVILISNELKAQDVYKLNADTVRLTNHFYMLAKTDGDIVYYTLNISQFHTEFENLYFKDFINKESKVIFKTISFKDGQEAIFAVDKKYSRQDILSFLGTANKMTMTKNHTYSDIEKQNFVTKAKETKNNK